MNNIENHPPLEYIINNEGMRNFRIAAENNDAEELHELMYEIVITYIGRLPNIPEQVIRNVQTIVNVNTFSDNYDYHFANLNDYLARVILANIYNAGDVNEHISANIDRLIIAGDPHFAYAERDNVQAEAGVEEVRVEAQAQAEEPDYINPMSIPTREPLDQETFCQEIGTACSICYRDMELINLTVTRCGHTFHASCLFQSFEYSPMCPICRTQLVLPNLD